MKLYSIFGDPVSHSKSPLMHNCGFKNLDIDACYTRYHLDDGERLLEKFKELKLSGANITVPHKEWAYRLADEIDGNAKEIKAVNTLVKKNGKIVGYNSDGEGFYESIKDLDISSALILGAGGTAKAIAITLRDKFDIEVLNRSEKRLNFFRENSIKSSTWNQFQPKKFDLIINTTSAGLSDDSLPIDKELLVTLFKNSSYAIDVIYGKDTPFLKLAKEYNLKSSDGKDMLLMQGVIAFWLFTDKKYSKDKIKKYLENGLELG
jgi:shikimate dehydrogenase